MAFAFDFSAILAAATANSVAPVRNGSADMTSATIHPTSVTALRSGNPATIRQQAFESLRVADCRARTLRVINASPPGDPLGIMDKAALATTWALASCRKCGACSDLATLMPPPA